MLRGVKANTHCVSADVLGEDSVLKWYQEAHLPKGKRVFLDQMKSFVQWLQNAEEGRFGSFNAIHCYTKFHEFMLSTRQHTRELICVGSFCELMRGHWFIFKQFRRFKR